MVYDPQEDSFLIEKEVKQYAKGRVLDMGTGSGILALAAASRKAVTSVTAVDFDHKVIHHCKKTIADKKIHFDHSDLFSNVKGHFDTIIFNPPYLPYHPDEPKELELAICGGKHGYELIERFFDSIRNHLAEDGIIILLFSTLTIKDKVDEFIRSHLLMTTCLSQKRITFETLYVYLLKKSRLLKELEKKGMTDIKNMTHGHRGVIYTAKWNKKKVTIKAQRPDIDATGTVDNEAKQLKVLNKYGIGPTILHSGKDYFIYNYVEGEFILDYLEKMKKAAVLKADKEKGKTVLLKMIRLIFSQMRQLDKLGLNKEEMHHPVKHVIVKNPTNITLLDFERCKYKEKTHNVTQFCQFVISGHMKPYIEYFNISLDRIHIILESRKYHADMSDEHLENILSLLK